MAQVCHFREIPKMTYYPVATKIPKMAHYPHQLDHTASPANVGMYPLPCVAEKLHTVGSYNKLFYKRL